MRVCIAELCLRNCLLAAHRPLAVPALSPLAAGKKIAAFVPNDGCLNFIEENVRQRLGDWGWAVGFGAPVLVCHYMPALPCGACSSPLPGWSCGAGRRAASSSEGAGAHSMQLAAAKAAGEGGSQRPSSLLARRVAHSGAAGRADGLAARMPAAWQAFNRLLSARSVAQSTCGHGS